MNPTKFIRTDTMPEKKPYILLLISDEHRPDVLPVEGNGIVRTPVLDRFMEEGVYFRNAYTPSPVCVPARQSFLSGLYPRRSGCLDFSTALPSEVLTIPGHLSRYGYRGVAAGKMHFRGPDQMHGWHERIGRDISGRNGYELVDDAVHGALIEPEPGTGQYSVINTPNSKFAKEIMNARAGEGTWMKQDRYSVDGMLQFLDEYFASENYDRPGAQPLLLAVSLSCPHYPFQCPKELFDYYLRRVEPIEEDLPETFDCHELFKVKIGEDVTYREAHRATAAYYGMVEWLDAQFGRVIDQLEHLNALDDFIVVYLSDHGEMLGEKGLWEKQQYFDASVRVPFSIWSPRHFEGGRIVHDNVSLVDLFPTLCELAHVPIPDGLDGRSVVSLARGECEDWPNTVYSELWKVHNGPSGMIKEGNLKYFRFTEQPWPEQLFDLGSDLSERKNLIADPAYAADLARLRARLDVLPPSREEDTH